MGARLARLGGNVPFFVRFLTLALCIGGFLGMLGNLLVTPAGFWVWPMPALALRFLAAAAAAYVVGSAYALTRPRWAESELLIATVLLYGLPLLLAMAFDAAQIDWGAPIAWAFVVVVSPAVLISVVYLWRNRYRTRAEKAPPPAMPTRSFLIILAVLAVGVGAWVYIAPKSAGVVWPWAELKAWTLLDSRLIASMLLTIGGGALLALWRNDRGTAQIFLVMLCAYCIFASIGVGLHAAVTPAFVGQDVTYIVIFGLVCLASLVLSIRERRSAA